MEDVIDKAGKLWDYAEKKVGKEKVNSLMEHLEFNNPHVLLQISIEKGKSLIDKFLMFNKIAKGEK